MGETINVATSGTRCISAYLAKPIGAPRGGIVVVQEIFGVTGHIQSVADGFAEQGYTAIAPAFYDHVETGVELEYNKAGIERGVALAREVGVDRAVEDVASAAQAINSSGRIGVVGYCWGGTVAFVAGMRLGLPAVSYYGSRNVQYLGEPVSTPLMFHIGENDHSIPPEAVERHRKELPDAEVFTYPAGHGFNCDQREDYDAASARDARKRTLAFFEKHLRDA